MPEYWKMSPLGFNCELAFVLEKKGYSQSREYFAWTFGRVPSVLKMIEADFDNPVRSESLIPHPGGELVWDTHYDIAYHSPLVSNGSNTFQAADHERLKGFFEAGLKRKARYFMNDLTSDQTIAYLVKYDGDAARNHAIELRDLLVKKRAGAPFDIYFIQEVDRAEDDWREPGIINRYISRFSPILAARDIDYEDWNRVLQDVALKIPVG